ncbi:MAG TPA: hypothetical protein VGN69_10965 [Solirubrobacteraceae bacterium]|nr:hypothetical protein [Solirubrobacteraceae bacterium]
MRVREWVPGRERAAEWVPGRPRVQVRAPVLVLVRAAVRERV